MPQKAPRPCWYPGCRNLNCTLHARPNLFVRLPEHRPTAAMRGYGSHWQKQRKAFLLAHPYCEDCGSAATIADHEPSRRELVRQGVADPDADQYLHPRCQTCHNRKTNKLEGGGWHGRE